MVSALLPVPLPPPLRLTLPPYLFMALRCDLFFVSLLFPPSTARAPLYWLFFYRFILYKYARSNSYTSYTKIRDRVYATARA